MNIFAPKKRQKYGNQKTDGFDSAKEARRYKDLVLLQKAGHISELHCQVPFVIVPKTTQFREARYVADFTYIDMNGKYTVEDTKGFATREFILKKKLMFHVFGIEIFLT